jgi:hypothetical protein
MATTTNFGWTTPDDTDLVKDGAAAIRTLGSSEVTISSITNANKLMILCVGNSTTSGLSTFFIKINGDSGANYYQNGIAFDVGNTYSDQKIARGEGINPATNGFYLAQMSGVAGSVFNGYMLIDGGNSAGLKVVSASGGTSPAGSYNHVSRSFGGYYDSSSTISSVSIRTDGTFDAGTIYVYKSA